jgi:signal peptidase I
MTAREKPQSEKTEIKNALRENVKTFIWAAIIAVLIRSLLFQPFNIPSSSMKPTLLIGDFLFVTKFSYGYSRHSFPFSPNLFSGRMVADVPERGDVVVFKLPADNRTDFIKRVIGLWRAKKSARLSIMFRGWATARSANIVKPCPMGSAISRSTRLKMGPPTIPAFLQCRPAIIL